jgi:hypothetical protein
MFVNVESKKNKTKCGLFAERGRRQRGLCRGLLAVTLGNSGKKFLSSGVPSFAERSCQKRLAKNFFLKNKKRLCQMPLPRTLGTGFFQKKIEKPSLPTASARGSRHRIFFQKNRKNHLC